MRVATYYKRKPFVYVEEVTAVKEHLCECCKKLISPGTNYFRRKSMNEQGQFKYNKYCDPCYSTKNV